MFIRFIQGLPWDEAALADDPPLNGAAMRIAPIGLWDHDRPEELSKNVFVASITTHRHPQAFSGALAIASAVAYVITHKTFLTKDFLESVTNTVGRQDPDFAAHISLVGTWDALTEIEALKILDTITDHQSYGR